MTLRTLSTNGIPPETIAFNIWQNNALCSKGWHFWKGGVFTDKTGLKIFVFINAMIFAFTTFVKNTPLYGKIASKVWKIYFQYISPHFLDAAGGQISDLWLLLLSNSSLFSALMSHLPLLLLHSALYVIDINKNMDSKMVTPCSIRFEAIGQKKQKCFGNTSYFS